MQNVHYISERKFPIQNILIITEFLSNKKDGVFWTCLWKKWPITEMCFLNGVKFYDSRFIHT